MERWTIAIGFYWRDESNNWIGFKNAEHAKGSLVLQQNQGTTSDNADTSAGRG